MLAARAEAVGVLVGELAMAMGDVAEGCEDGSLKSGKISTVEHYANKLFEAGNTAMLALPNITDGSEESTKAEAIAGKTRMLCRINVRAFAKAANTFCETQSSESKDKVLSLHNKAKVLMSAITAIVDDL